MTIDFKAIFDQFNKANAKEWEHDRNKTVGASEVFGCIRQAWFKKRGKEFDYLPDDGHVDGWGATSRGDLIENYHAVPALKSFLPEGAKLLGAGKKQKTLVSGKNSATPDGVITGLDSDCLSLYGVEDIEGDCILVEFKSFDPRISLRKPKEIHVGQVQQQMGIIREKTPLRPMYAVILYFNASFLDDMKVFPVRFDEKMWESAQQRANMVFEVDDPSKMMAEGKMDGGCEYCPFKQACASVMKGAFPKSKKKTKDPEIAAEIERLADIRQDAQDRKNEAERAEALAAEELKEYLRSHGITGTATDKVSVSYIFNPGRKGLDRKAMEADGIDLSSYETNGLPYEVLRVTYK